MRKAINYCYERNLFRDNIEWKDFNGFRNFEIFSSNIRSSLTEIYGLNFNKKSNIKWENLMEKDVLYVFNNFDDLLESNDKF